MGFIKNALIGIVLYEAVSYLINKKTDERSLATNAPRGFSAEEPTCLAADWDDQDIDNGLKAATDPETPLTRHDLSSTDEDVWKSSLANDELRAPDA